ncbi:MAG: hypothetical protein M0Z36_12655 [Thermaerobacter sp.]|nr:hypothetical protein [Thermaerobacter sp.]
MWWSRRRSAPLWVWVLAFLGFKSVWYWVRSGDPAWQDKRRRFRRKLDEAFDVWRDDASKPDGEGAEDR